MLPRPGVLSTVSVPPMPRASSRLMASPRPNPRGRPSGCRASNGWYRVCLHEGLEDAIELARGVADTGIGHRDPHAPIHSYGAERHAPSARRELDGVSHEVHENLNRACAVSLDSERSTTVQQSKSSPASRSCGAQERLDRAQEFAHRHDLPRCAFLLAQLTRAKSSSLLISAIMCCWFANMRLTFSQWLVGSGSGIPSRMRLASPYDDRNSRVGNARPAIIAPRVKGILSSRRPTTAILRAALTASDPTTKGC